jgi:hypothetical protein
MPITSSPSSGAGGGSASSAVGVSPVFSSAPLNPSSITTNTNPMALGITTLQRMLNDSSKKETQNPSNRYLSIDSKNIIVSDVADSRYKEAIVKMVEKGYMKNTKKFDPKRAMTRAEFIKVLSLAYGFEEFTDFDTSFSDLQGSEFEKYVNFGVIMGWINPDMEKFRPNDAITMGEARKLINAAKEQSDAHAPAMNKEILSREHGANLIFEEIVIL